VLDYILLYQLIEVLRKLMKYLREDTDFPQAGCLNPLSTECQSPAVWCEFFCPSLDQIRDAVGLQPLLVYVAICLTVLGYW